MLVYSKWLFFLLEKGNFIHFVSLTLKQIKSYFNFVRM